MLEFFIALFGGLYYGAKIWKEKQKAADARLSSANKRLLSAKFIELHADPTLEGTILAKINTPEQHEELWSRVSEVLHSLEHWKDYSRKDFDLSKAQTKQIVLDILMADQGKIPLGRLELGYLERCGVYQAKNEKHQEYIEWVGRRVKEQGADAHLVKQIFIGPEYEYVWQGSEYYRPDKLMMVVT